MPFFLEMINYANTHGEAVAQNAGQRQKNRSSEAKPKNSIWRPHTKI